MGRICMYMCMPVRPLVESYNFCSPSFLKSNVWVTKSVYLLPFLTTQPALPYTLITEHTTTPRAFTIASITSSVCASSPSPAMVLPQLRVALNLPLPKDS